MAVYPTKERVLVEGVNTVTKHKKPSAQNPQGGIIQEEAPIHISNVRVLERGERAGAKGKASAAVILP